jgi:predicted RNA-binding Zn-ribbon protein involved in translation (DUF1610 family)
MTIEDLAIQQRELDRFGRAQHAEDEDEVGGYGMRADEVKDEYEDEDEAGGPQVVRYSCEGCGEVSRVLPPKGYRYARSGEGEDEAGLRPLQYRCAHCGETNRVRATVVRESAAIRVYRESYGRE